MALRRDKLNGLTGGDLVIAYTGMANDSGEPLADVCMDEAMDLGANEGWQKFEGVPPHQQTVMRVIINACMKARQAKDPQRTLTEIAMYGAMLMARTTERIEYPGE